MLNSSCILYVNKVQDSKLLLLLPKHHRKGKKNSRGESEVISNSGLPQAFLVGLLFKSQTPGNSLFQLSMEICKFPWFQKLWTALNIKWILTLWFYKNSQWEHKTWTGPLLEAEDKKEREHIYELCCLIPENIILQPSLFWALSWPRKNFLSREDWLLHFEVKEEEDEMCKPSGCQLTARLWPPHPFSHNGKQISNTELPILCQCCLLLILLPLCF